MLPWRAARANHVISLFLNYSSRAVTVLNRVLRVSGANQIRFHRVITSFHFIFRLFLLQKGLVHLTALRLKVAFTLNFKAHFPWSFCDH